MSFLEIDTELLLINYSIYGDLKGVKRMIEAGVNCNTPSYTSFPLYEAASKGHIEVAEYLLSLDNIIVNRLDGETGYAPIHSALFYSFYSNRPKLFELFVNNSKTDLYITSIASMTHGFTPAHLAAYVNYITGLKILLDNGVDHHYQTETGLSILDVAGESRSCRENSNIVKNNAAILIRQYEKELVK